MSFQHVQKLSLPEELFFQVLCFRYVVCVEENSVFLKIYIQKHRFLKAAGIMLCVDVGEVPGSHVHASGENRREH